MSQSDKRFPALLAAVLGILGLLGLGCAALDPCGGDGPPCQNQFLEVAIDGYLDTEGIDSGSELPSIRLTVVNPSGATQTHEAQATWVEGEGFSLAGYINSYWSISDDGECPNQQEFSLSFDIIGAGWSDTGGQSVPTIEAAGDEVQVDLWEGWSASLFWYGPIC